MKATKLLFPVLLLGSLTAFTSCSDDDDNNGYKPTSTPGVADPAQVFTNGMPTQVGAMKFTKNAQGQVTTIEENYGTEKTIYTFTYKASPARAEQTSPAAKADVTMTVTEGTEVESVFYINLNEQGYAQYAYQVTSDDSEHWYFDYTPAGQLRSMKRSEGGNEVTTITYDGSGDITKVTMKGDSSSDNYIISYTDENHSTPIDNKGAIMFFDECFGIDMDEFAPAYYAGLLGKATTHLPLSNVEDGETDTFTWSLNESGFPVTFIQRSNGVVDGSPKFFNWL